MEEKDSKTRVIDDAEKRCEEIERLQKRVEEMEKKEAARAAEAAALQEKLDDFEKEKSMMKRRVAIDKEELEHTAKQLEREKKRSEESDAIHKEKPVLGLIIEAALEGEKNVLRGEVVGLNEENGILKEEVTELKRRMKEMEEEKLSNVKETGDISTQTEEKSANLVVKEEKIDESKSTPHDNQIHALNFTEEDFKLEEEEIGNMEGIDQLYGNGIFDDLSTFKDEPMGDSLTIPDEMNFKKEDIPDYDENFGMGDANMGMENSFFNQPFNNDTLDLGTIDNIDDPTVAEKNSINDVSLGVENVNGIAQSETSHVIREDEQKRRPSRNSSKSVNYNESMEDSDEDGGPSVKKSKLENGKRIEQKRTSTPKKDQSESTTKAKLSDTEMNCPECEFHTRSVCSLCEHLRRIHNTTLILAGLSLLCECGIESYSAGSRSHVYTCNIANFTVIRKSEGPIQRLDDKKVTPQCILCEDYPKTALGYATHLRRNHKSTAKENGIFLLCSCGLRITSDGGRTHNIDCDPHQFTIHKLDEK